MSCAVCCFFFCLIFSYPDLVSSCGKPDCKKNKRDASNRDRLYNPFAFAGVSVVSPLTTFHPKSYSLFVVRPHNATRTDQCSGELGRQHVSEGD